MKHINLFSFMFILVIAAGCSRDFDYYISNSVFIEDSDNPGLPIYSEKGYNSFGVYWGLSPFTTKRPHDPSKIVVKNDSCHIYFSGAVGSNSYTFSGAESDPYTLVISIPEYTPDAFTGLLSLGGKTFSPAKAECAVSLLSGNQPMELKILSGAFTVKRAQNMYVDKELHGVILSGTFSLKATVDDIGATFSNGRFDMRFGDENFFYLQED